MKNLFTRYPFASLVNVILVLTVLLTSACAPAPITAASLPPEDGQVLLLAERATAWGVRQALIDKPFTLVMGDAKGNFSFFWSLKDIGWGNLNLATRNLDGTAKSVWQLAYELNHANGNLVNGFTAGDLAKHLENNGWGYIKGAAVDSTLSLASALTSSVLIDATIQVGGSRMFMLMMPITNGTLPLPPGVAPPEDT